MNLLHLEAGLADAQFHIFGVVHLRVAIGERGKVKARHRQAQGRGLKFLAVPEGLHDIDTGIVGHSLPCTLEDADDLLHAEAVEKLAHPDGIRTLRALWKLLRLIKQVNAIAFDALMSRLVLDILLHHRYLLRKVEDGNLRFLTITHAVERPFACVAAYIVERSHMVLVENNVKRIRKRRLTVEVVEAEPTLLNVFGKARQAFVDRRPWPEMAQACGSAFLQRFFEVESSLVVNVVIEVDVHTGSGIVEQEPSRFGKREALCLRIKEHGTYAQGCF